MASIRRLGSDEVIGFAALGAAEVVDHSNSADFLDSGPSGLHDAVVRTLCDEKAESWRKRPPSSDARATDCSGRSYCRLLLRLRLGKDAKR